MANGAEQWVTVATGLTEARANELALVLIARNLPFQRQAGPNGWELWVPFADAPAAASSDALVRASKTVAAASEDAVSVVAATASRREARRLS